jgi:Tfp pilus assembly protein PilE
MIVILIIGILAAIALPVFLSQQSKSQDASAKSNATNLAHRVEACFTPNEDFTKCDTLTELIADGEDVGVPYGAGNGQAQVTAATTRSYTVVAKSAKPDGNGVVHAFTIVRDLNGATTRSCTASNSNNNGGCINGNW